MKKSRFALAGIASFLLMGIGSAYADSYFVEIGKDTTQAEAEGEWKELVAKHKSLLGKLKFYPKAVYEGGEPSGARIQAGPINNKSHAQKICNRLFDDNVPCFVIEGVEDDTPPTAMMNLNDRTEQQASVEGGLPWLHASEVGASAEVRGATLPWLVNKAPQQGEVQIAEAIRVPLSEKKESQREDVVPREAPVTVRSLEPEARPTFRKPFAQSKLASAETDGAGWLAIDSFPNEDIATSFWEEARASVSKKQANSLRVRVSKSLMSNQKASLSVGPFVSASDAYAFCDKVQAKERGLSCSYMGADPAAVGNTQFASRGDEYNARREALGRKPLSGSLGTIAPAAGPSKQYWVQVVKAPSQLEALNQWDEMRSSNADLLNGMRSSVSASATDRSAYVVRVGPIADNDEAIRFCTKLQGRGIACKVLLYSLRM